MPFTSYMAPFLSSPAVTSVRPRMDNDVHNVTVIEGHEAILPCVVNNLGRHQVK
ncbi:lachesin, partial [Biomphalaria pfeifferi]